MIYEYTLQHIVLIIDINSKTLQWFKKCHLNYEK